MTAVISDSAVFPAFRRHLREHAGIHLEENRRHQLLGRLEPLLSRHNLSGLAALLRKLETTEPSTLFQELLEALNGFDSPWFRDSYPYEILKHHVLPEMARQSRHQLRLWSVGCGAGEEPYAISMILEEFVNECKKPLPDNLQIIATDSATPLLQLASNARYSTTRLHGLSEERLQRFFTLQGEQWEIMPRIRYRVAFRQLDLAAPLNSLGSFDIVFCRNLLLHYPLAQRSALLERIVARINPGGYLFLGGAESPASPHIPLQITRTAYGAVYSRCD